MPSRTDTRVMTASELANGLSLVRETFYKRCASTLAGITGRCPGATTPSAIPSTETELLMAAYQLREMRRWAEGHPSHFTDKSDQISFLDSANEMVVRPLTLPTGEAALLDRTVSNAMVHFERISNEVNTEEYSLFASIGAILLGIPFTDKWPGFSAESLGISVETVDVIKKVLLESVHFFVTATHLTTAVALGEQDMAERLKGEFERGQFTPGGILGLDDYISAKPKGILGFIAANWRPRESLAEVHFHKSEEASCLIKVPFDDDFAMADELFLWAAFTNHQLNSIGKDLGLIAPSLAGMTDLPKAIKDDWGLPPLLAYHPCPGFKQFIGMNRHGPHGTRFTVHRKGFGILGRGANELAILSVIYLLRHIAAQRIRNSRFIRSLEYVANRIGSAWLSGDVDMRDSASIAFNIVIRTIA